uniref:Phospholipase B1, membrane-associated n=1 Tax=Glossina brevipalpis TaxID=37001 RepID=A0A1A9WTA0_9MUSC
MWYRCQLKRFILYSIIFLLNIHYEIECQRTWLDDKFIPFLRIFRSIGRYVVDPPSDYKHKLNLLRERGKLQEKLQEKLEYPLLSNCNTKNGPGARSEQIPDSVHRLRPGDIDIIGAMGDSLTAGNGILAINPLQVLVENRGKSWSGGGEGNLQQYLTLPNILKEFNPNLYGYTVKDSLTIERDSKFNVAEPAATSRDMPYMAEILVKRMKYDSHVNMTHHWKLITLFIGSNDFCSHVCFHSNPMDAIDFHEKDMLKTLRYLRDNVPRLMVNVMPAINLLFLTKFKNLPPLCDKILTFACPCLIKRSKDHQRFMDQLMTKWFERDVKIATKKEFNTETFTINVQKSFKNFSYPTLPNGKPDLSYSSEDCFHISQKTQALAATAYWNSMLELMNDVTEPLTPNIYGRLNCPTEENPYLLTRLNIEKDFPI